ncbi:hypothetical protein D5266_08720 [bacterium c-19]|nr:hypothetical protein [bacterium c-19]
MSKLRISKEERERMYIKEELMRYYMYKEKIQEIENDIIQFKQHYQEVLNHPHFGGSIIHVQGNSGEKQNIVMRLEYQLADLQSNLTYYQSRIAELDRWLSVLTDIQYQIAMIYICQYQCKDVYGASLELNYAQDTIKAYTDRILKRIQKKFNKIF